LKVSTKSKLPIPVSSWKCNSASSSSNRREHPTRKAIESLYRIVPVRVDKVQGLVGVGPGKAHVRVCDQKLSGHPCPHGIMRAWSALRDRNLAGKSGKLLEIGSGYFLLDGCPVMVPKEIPDKPVRITPSDAGAPARYICFAHPRSSLGGASINPATTTF
jgi:hypothetical protein